MSTARIQVSNIEVQIVRKNIKNLHLAVYPPDGHVRVAVPNHITDDNIRLAVISKLGWIKKQQRLFRAQPRQSQREMLTGESHYFQGRRYRLDVQERPGRHELKLMTGSRMRLYIHPGTTQANCERVLNEWYRAQLKQRVPELIAKWEPIIGVQVKDWGVRKMRTRWGTCNIVNQCIWLNLELAKKPPECLEYIVVHEMVHLLERHHNDRFRQYLDTFLPQWQLNRDLLNRSPLAHEDWVS